MTDNRNVTDEFKGMTHENIVEALNARGVKLQIAVENLQRDFNMGTIVRTANAFGVRIVHVVGRRQWNKRGAMMTDKYLTIEYHNDVGSFIESVRPRKIIAVDNVANSQDLRKIEKSHDCVLVFGAEGPGLSDEMQEKADAVAHIPQLGSTRSINVGVAAGIAMWEWVR